LTDRPRSAAVVVISHNYGRYLPECLSSVLAQTLQPAEIIVIDDSSTDDTPDVVRRFAKRGVRYQRVACHDVHQARRAGFESVRSDAICFLDADDLLPVDYLAAGLAGFSSSTVGFVYSDVESFGDDVCRSAYPEQFDRSRLEQDNFVHAGSLVRREALRVSQVFNEPIDPLVTHGDWFLWRSLARDGWIGVKQRALYRYRKHGANFTLAMHETGIAYFDYAGLRHETVTLFIPLSGRSALWPNLCTYLDRQSWPHDQIRLILLDTSQDRRFAATIREWIAVCDYADVHHIRATVGRLGLADDDRHQPEVAEEVRTAVARIYNRMAREIDTDYVWVVEDDILPPDDACERLLRGFDRHTASVSAMYLSRYDGGPCVWGPDFHQLPFGDGIQQVHGNGFGCVILRGGVVRQTQFRATGDYDRQFYRDLQSTGLKARIDWETECEHHSAEAVGIPSPPDVAELVRVPDVGVPPLGGLTESSAVAELARVRAAEAPASNGLPAPARPRIFGRHRSKINLLRRPDLPKPWEQYPLTVCIPYLDTPDLLQATVRLWQLQSTKPYILIVDTGSTSQQSADVLAKLEEQPGIEICRTGIVCAVEHLSDRVAIAMDYAFSRCPTEHLLATHVDVFPKNRDLVEKYLPLCNDNHPVVGWEMSPRGPGDDGPNVGTLSNGFPGHAFILFHIPTMDRIGAGWSMRRAHHAFGLPRVKTDICGWPDTEVCLGKIMVGHGIKPMYLGRESNADVQETEDWIHARSSTVQLLLHRRYPDTRAQAYQAAVTRADEWEREARQNHAVTAVPLAPSETGSPTSNIKTCMNANV
jgi:glycosyltransferase involved in cell wall biosynthesis